MRKLLLFIAFVIAVNSAAAQASNDSLAYQLQRKKINGMLAQRTRKFGQYDQSLSMHTGIFGLQTKKDIRRSNDILMDIVRTDNAIYKELKILLDYRTFQQTQVSDHSKEAEQSNIGFMNAINKQRNQIDQLKAEAVKQQEQQQKNKTLFIIVLLILIAFILFLLTRATKKKN